MIKRNKFIIAAVVAAGMIVPTAAKAVDLHIELGDRGYYTHGASYWNGDYEYVWVPGFYSGGHHWHHGYYRKGQHRHHHSDDHHHDHHDH